MKSSLNNNLFKQMTQILTAYHNSNHIPIDSKNQNKKFLTKF